MNLLQLLPFLQRQETGGGINMDIPAGIGMRMPNLPSAAADAVGLKAPAGALGLSQAAGNNPQQMANLAMMLMQSGQPKAAPAAQVANMIGPRGASSQQTQQFMQQYGPQNVMQMQQLGDDAMRQRMQGLMALLGGQ